MSSMAIISTLVAYMLLLLGVSYISGRKTDNEGFFIGNRRTSWYMATLAMIGAAMSGVTFISVPGSVASDGMSYMQMVIGFTIGQLIVAFVLIPLFYRLKVISLYEYLDQRFGITTRKTGAWCFLVAKLIGASLKVFIVCVVLQLLVFESFNTPFWLTSLLIMICVWSYTRSGGVRTLIPTDIIQSILLISSVVICIVYLAKGMHLASINNIYETIIASPHSRIWIFDNPASPRYFWKMVAGGILCLVAMTGLDQDMMQRNMSCRSVRDSQTNIILTAICQIGVILLLLVLGVLLYAYIDVANLPMPSHNDDTFPFVATHNGLPQIVGIMFVLGLISSTYSAAGSALTSLTTSFTLDIMQGSQNHSEETVSLLRKRTHIVMALLMTILIIIFNKISGTSVINLVFKIAGYTYGPILGLFLFGMITRRAVRGGWVPWIALLSPLLSGLLQWFVAAQYDYHIGFELLGYNALITFFGLLAISHKKSNINHAKQI